jgi:hypothetical protein
MKLAIILAALGAGALVSAFMYAAFGTTWWTPLPAENFTSHREAVLFILHTVMLVLGVAAACYIAEKARD